jgi:hypothetical protein
MRIKFSILTILALFLFSRACRTAPAQQDSIERFTLHGKVVNTASGEPVAGALLQLSSQASQFSDSEGGFTFTDVPADNFVVEAKKPGFLHEGELGERNVSRHRVYRVPAWIKATGMERLPW